MMNNNLLKKNILKTVACLSAITMVFTSTGCVADDAVIDDQDNNITISFSWWGTDDRNQYTLDAVKNFEALHPNIKVDTKYSEWTGYEKRTNIEMASGTEADVMQINYAWINTFSPDGKTYYDLNKLSNIIDLSNFSDSELEYGYEDDSLQAIPIAMNTMTFFYNEKVLKKYGVGIPKTLDDLYDDAKIMSKDGVYPLGCASKSAWFFITSIEEQRAGKSMFSEDNKLQFTSDNFSDMITICCDMIKNSVIDDINSYDKTKFESGDYAGELIWISDAANYFPNTDPNDISIGPYIVENKNKPLEWYVKPATMYAIDANTEHPEESAMLLDFLLNSSEMAQKQGTEKGIPISKKARKVLEQKNMLKGTQYNAYEELHKNFDKTKQSSPYFEESSIIDGFFDAVNKVQYKNYSPDTAANELRDIIKKAISD